MKGILLTAAIGGIVLVAPVLASPVTFIDHAPWDLSRMPAHVDQGQLVGEISSADLADLVKAGSELFSAQFTSADGEGRPTATQALIPTHFKHARELTFQRASGPDSSSCFSCHSQPKLGGAGDFAANAFTSEGTESADFDSVDSQFSNERNSPILFGSGLKELIAREMTVDLQTLRDKTVAQAQASGKPVDVELVSKGVDFGKIVANPDGTLDESKLDGIDPDLIVRPFGRKGVFTSLREMTITALNNHFGMEADERFGPAVTGEVDFDGDGVPDEMTPGNVSAMVAFQATLPASIPVAFGKPDWDAAAAKGKALFAQIGCASCHMASMPLHSLVFSDPSPYDEAGTLTSRDVAEVASYDLDQFAWAKALPRDANGDVLVPIFSDFKRHEIADSGDNFFANEIESQAFTGRDTFMTPPLWGVADTAPWGHRGDLTTLDAVIMHHAGEARPAREAFAGLPPDDQHALVAYLMTLRTPQ